MIMVGDSETVWITERDVVDLLGLRSAVRALEDALAKQASGAAATMVKTHATWGDRATLHALGGTLPHAGLVGVKCWAHTPAGASPLLVLFDAGDGRTVAIIEAFALGQLRTSAVSAVATDRLAGRGASEMAIAGTGKQAFGQVAAVLAVRPVKRVHVWSRTAGAAARFGDRLAGTLAVEVVLHGSVAEAVADIPIVTLATRAVTPFLAVADVAPGTHVNAIGAITPERAEFEPGLLDRAEVVVADNVTQTRALAREFITYFGQDEAAWQRVRDLSDLVASGRRRPPGADVTVFKAMGIGLADVALGAHVLEAARVAGRGRGIPSSEPADAFQGGFDMISKTRELDQA